MGSKQGPLVRFMMLWGNKMRFHIEAKKWASCAAVFAGFTYGDWTGGSVQEGACRIRMEELTAEYETRHQNYQAKAREMAILEAKLREEDEFVTLLSTTN